MPVSKKKVLELYDFGEGMSIRQVSEATGYSRNTVTKIIGQAGKANLTKEVLGETDERQLAELLAPEKPSLSYAEPDMEYIHKEMEAAPHINLKLMWSEYLDECTKSNTRPYQYAHFCALYNKWAKRTGVTRRIIHKPGYALQTDWVGTKGQEVCDRITGEVLKSHYFVAVCPYTPFLYVEAFPDEKEQSWIAGHIHAYRYLGGVPRITVCDNLRTGVKRPDRYEPVINDTYAHMAEYYGTTIVPTRTYHPKGKAAVERAVRTVETWIIGALRKRTFFSFSELNDAVREKVDELNASNAPDKDISRFDLFAECELPNLLPLPREDFQITEHRTATLQPDSHFQFEKMRYSAPAELIGCNLDLIVSASTVGVYHRGEFVCSHRRLTGRIGQYSTVEAHMPEHLRGIDTLWSETGFKRWAKKMGPSVLAATEAILASRPIVEQAYRSLRGLMNLGKKRGAHLLEEACNRALSISATPSYTQIKNILQTIEDEAVSHTDISELSGGNIGDAGFLRDPADYGKDDTEESDEY
jgi:transposase